MSKLAIALAMSAMALGLAVSAAPAPARAQSEAATVRQLYDKELILDMMARYCFALDDADGATYAAMFTQDGVLISGNGANVQKGRAAIKAYRR